MKSETSKRRYLMKISRGILIKSVRVSAVVGTVLVLINHFGMFSAGYLTTTRIIQIILCYVVPFGVSFYSQITPTQQKLPDLLIPSEKHASGR
jgi:hypothetical protein